MQLTAEDKKNPLKSVTECQAFMNQALEISRHLGASQAMASFSHDHGFNVDVRMGEVETVSFSENQGLSITVYFGHKKGSASCTDLSLMQIEKMVKAACDIAMVSAEDPCYGLADASLMRQAHPDLDLFHPWAIHPTQAIELALSCEAICLQKDTRIVNSDGVNISTGLSIGGFATSHGGMGCVQTSHHSISASLIAKDGDVMERDYDYTYVRDPSKLSSIDTLASSVVERTVSRLGARQVKTGKYPVIFSSRLSGGLFSSLLGALSGSNLYRKNSFLLDSLGKQVLPEWVQVYEQPYLSGGLGSSAFDGEGVTTRDNVFIKDGRVEQYLLGVYSARRLGLETSANAGGVHNMTVSSNSEDLEDLIRQMDKGLLVTELMGQGVNILTGDYSRGASGFWVEHGQIQYPVHNITIAANLKDVYQRIVAIGNDHNPNISSRCGSVLVSEMTVAGA